MNAEIVGNITDLVKAIDQRIYPGDNPAELVNHERAHAMAYESYGGSGDYGFFYITYIQKLPKIIDDAYIIWEQLLVEVVSGAFFLPDEPMEDIPPEVRMDMAAAPGFTEMSGNHQWGDWAIWWQAHNELLEQEWLESSTGNLVEPSDQQDRDEPDAASSPIQGTDDRDPMDDEVSQGSVSITEPINYWGEDISNPYSDEKINPDEYSEKVIIVDPSIPQVIFQA